MCNPNAQWDWGGLFQESMLRMDSLGNTRVPCAELDLLSLWSGVFLVYQWLYDSEGRRSLQMADH